MVVFCIFPVSSGEHEFVDAWCSIIDLQFDFMYSADTEHNKIKLELLCVFLLLPSIQRN